MPRTREKPIKQPGQWACRRLRDLRLAKGMSQAAMAAAVPCVRSYISKYERDWCCPNIEHLTRLAAVLGADIRDLLNRAISIETLVTITGGCGQTDNHSFLREMVTAVHELSPNSRAILLFAAKSLSEKQLPLDQWQLVT